MVANQLRVVDNENSPAGSLEKLIQHLSSSSNSKITVNRWEFGALMEFPLNTENPSQLLNFPPQSLEDLLLEFDVGFAPNWIGFVSDDY